MLQVGYTNFACFVGTLVGLATAGPLSDWVADRSTRRNGGIREPEMRLPALVPFIILAVIGQVISAVGAQNQWTWEPVVVVEYFFTGIQVSSQHLNIPVLALAPQKIAWLIISLGVCRTWNSNDLRHGLLQARHRPGLPRSHRGEEHMGLWGVAIFEQLEQVSWICDHYYVQYGAFRLLQWSLWLHAVDVGEEGPRLDPQ